MIEFLKMRGEEKKGDELRCVSVDVAKILHLSSVILCVCAKITHSLYTARATRPGQEPMAHKVQTNIWRVEAQRFQCASKVLLMRISNRESLTTGFTLPIHIFFALLCGFCYRLRHARLIWNVCFYVCATVCCVYVCMCIRGGGRLSSTKIIWKLWALDLNTNEQIIDFIEKCQRDG